MRTTFCLTLCLALCQFATADNWPRFRGAEGTGHCHEKDVPVKWSANDVKYRVELKGQGQSSPVIWGDHIFLTSSTDQGQTRHVMCLNRANGKVVWQQSVSCGAPQPVHRMNSWATASCATDGELVFAFFGEGGLHCYTVDGKKKWSKELGSFPGNWGNAASPVILGDHVIQNCDASGASYLLAIEKKTGKQVWRTKRADKPRGGWSTPILIDTGKRKELILNGEFGVRSYDPKSGRDYWFCKGFNGRGTPVPAWGHGMLYVINGKPGDVYAVKPDGSGDVTSSRMAWHTARRGGRDLPSPILVGDFLFTVSMGGVAMCYDAKSGKPVWEPQRLKGSYSASPIAANGLIYIQNEAGETSVIKPRKSFQLMTLNSLGDIENEIFRSTLAISKGQIFCRSDTALYCIDK